MAHRFESVQQVRDGLKDVNYLADDGIAGVAFLADRLGKPVSKDEAAASFTEYAACMDKVWAPLVGTGFKSLVRPEAPTPCPCTPRTR